MAMATTLCNLELKQPVPDKADKVMKPALHTVTVFVVSFLLKTNLFALNLQQV